MEYIDRMELEAEAYYCKCMEGKYPQADESICTVKMECTTCGNIFDSNKYTVICPDCEYEKKLGL